MRLRLEDRIATGDWTLDIGIGTLAVGGASGDVLYASTGGTGGITAWRLDDTGATLLDTQYSTGWRIPPPGRWAWPTGWW